MELYRYLAILRRRWRLVAGVPLLVALLSLAVATTRPPHYRLTARLLVTRADVGDRRITSPGGVDADDTVAYDLPAIVDGEPFARDVAAELARRGRPLSQDAVEQALHAENERRVVFLAASAPDAADTLAMAEAAVALIKTNGLRYWGDPRATPADPGINVAVLDLPPQPALVNGLTTIALEVALRALVALLAAAFAAFALAYLEEGI